MRATGSLTVLFVAGLGLAVLAGPASCPCDREAAASTEVLDSPPSLSRFTYAIASAATDEIGRPRASEELTAAPMSDAEGLPTLSNVAMIEPEEPAGASPITTSAIAPLAATARGVSPPSHVGLLPARTEALSDNAPRLIQLAAAELGDDAELAPVLPPVVVESPPLPEVKAVEPDAPDAEPAAEPRPRKHVSQRKKNHRARGAATSAKPDRVKLAKVPRWARQMFDTPWQNKAFSYIQ